MALIKCPNCNHDISDTVNKCIHCGAKIHKVEVKKKLPNDSIKEAKSQINNPITNNIFSNIKLKCDAFNILKGKKSLIRVITNIILTCIFIILIYFVETVITKHSGVYTLIDFLKWVLDNYISKSFVKIIDIVILGYLFIFLLLSCMKSISGKIIKAGYSIILTIEIVFIFFMYLVGYQLNIFGVLVPFYTIFWLLIECKFLKIDLSGQKKII